LIADANSDFLIYSREHKEAVAPLSGTAAPYWAMLRSRRS